MISEKQKAKLRDDLARSRRALASTSNALLAVKEAYRALLRIRLEDMVVYDESRRLAKMYRALRRRERTYARRVKSMQGLDGARRFHLQTVLSVVMGRYLYTTQSEFYEILNYMTGDDIWNTQFDRAIKECRPYILQQHPELAGETGQEITNDNYRAWLAERIGRYGEYLVLKPMPEGAHQWRNPIMEAVEFDGNNQD